MTELVPAPTRLATTAADRNPAAVYLARLAPGSRRTMAAALNTIANTASNGQLDANQFPWHELRYQHTQALRTHLTEKYSPATVNKHLSALRGVLEEAWHLDLMTAEDFHRARHLKGISETRLPAGRLVEPGEIAALAAACRADTSPIGARDGAMFGILFGAGLRAGELVGLHLADGNTDTGEIAVRHGKRRKQRTAYVQGGALTALNDWIAVRGPDAGPLICPVSKTGQVTFRSISTQAVWDRFAARSEQAKVPHLSPHDARRTWISMLLAAGADIVTVQKMAGHASVATTGGYDRRGEDVKRQAAGLLHFPWGPPLA